MMVRMRDVARAANVSISTAYKVYNHSEAVNQETVQHVQETAYRMGYTPKSLLNQMENACVGYLYAAAGPNSFTFIAMLNNALVKEFLNRKYHFISALLMDACDSEAVKLLNKCNVKGIIYNNGYGSKPPKKLVELTKKGLPVVQLFHSTLEKADTLLIDDELGSYNAIKEFIGHGHRRILCIQPSSFGNTPLWEAGYRRALRDYNLPFEPMLYIPLNRSENTKGIIKEKILRYQPTALLSICEELSISALQAVNELGLRIPDDISFIGYDDIRLFSSIQITAVGHPFEMMASAIADLLLRPEEQVPVSARTFERYIVDPQLIVRNSVGRLV